MYRFAVVLLFLSGCAPFEHSKLSQQKYLNPKAMELISQPIDDFLPDPPPAENDEEDDLEPAISPKFHTKVSISTTKDMLLINVLARLAESAGVNIVVAPDIEGNITCSAKKRQFIDILQDICDTANLKCTINNDTVKIEYDSPVLRTYNVQFLNIQRDMKSSIATSTDIFTEQMSFENGTTNSGSKNDNGSSSLITGTIKNDFWEELSANLTQIIGEDGHIAVHKQGGLVSVYAPQRKQNVVKKYLKLLKQSVESQVLIEAKILEVTLSDEFRGGINWTTIEGSRLQITNGKATMPTNMFSFGLHRKELDVLAGLIQRFGAVKTLSNPRITVLNNQAAVLKVAKNEVIYIPSLQKQYATNSNSNNFDYMSTNLHTIPIGLIMTVVPSIDRKTNSILLDLRPTISRIVERKKIPFFTHGVSIGSGGNATTPNYVDQEIPVVDVREFDSVIRLHSGQVAVMGGLMQEQSMNEREGLPRASQLDFIFGRRGKSTNVTELVIFLKATILHKKAYHTADEKLYKTFANDSRPLNFNDKSKKNAH